MAHRTLLCNFILGFSRALLTCTAAWLRKATVHMERLFRGFDGARLYDAEQTEGQTSGPFGAYAQKASRMWITPRRPQNSTEQSIQGALCGEAAELQPARPSARIGPPRREKQRISCGTGGLVEKPRPHGRSDHAAQLWLDRPRHHANTHQRPDL